MKVWVLAIGRASGAVAPAIGEYESRASRYWSLEVVELREERGSRARPATEVMEREGERMLERLPAGAEAIALTREGRGWSSERLARHLQELALHSHAGPAFLIGGANGLSRSLLERADHRLSLSPLTLPHDLARLVLLEQLYRAGTIARGEPYHKAGR